ncbi:MAG: hypothetical protein JSU80_12965 [Deltaproteobacteria bacterium]|nr:MAG: hypothetical protein JSU80_12965 [Deltaproteobacteria bacterium]
MRRLLESGNDFLVESGSLYVPLLFDPAIEREIRTIPDTSRPQQGLGSLLQLEGKHFVKSISLPSLVNNYENINKNRYNQLKSSVLQKISVKLDGGSTPFGWKLITIIFQIMPYFIKTNRGLERKKFGRKDVLKLIAEKVDIPPRDYERSNTFFDLRPFQEALQELDKLDTKSALPQDGVISSSELNNWLYRALEAQIIEKERFRLKAEVLKREQLVEAVKEDLDILLFVAEKGSLEIDDFGFIRIGKGDDYLIYKRSGEYILKDYYGRSYLFPDCRVAVPTFNPFRPVVMEKYKHPFLYAHDSGQEICLTGFSPPQEFSANNIIQVLEEGFNALLHGYDARRRRGYHSLDDPRQIVKTVEFDDYRIRDNSS